MSQCPGHGKYACKLRGAQRRELRIDRPQRPAHQHADRLPDRRGAGRGETVFPGIGLSVRPRRGNALYFEYANSRLQVDQTTLHAGAPVVEGENWVVTKWMRARRFAPASADCASPSALRAETDLHLFTSDTDDSQGDSAPITSSPTKLQLRLWRAL